MVGGALVDNDNRTRSARKAEQRRKILGNLNNPFATTQMWNVDSFIQFGQLTLIGLILGIPSGALQCGQTMASVISFERDVDSALGLYFIL